MMGIFHGPFTKLLVGSSGASSCEIFVFGIVLDFSSKKVTSILFVDNGMLVV